MVSGRELGCTSDSNGCGERVLFSRISEEGREEVLDRVFPTFVRNMSRVHHSTRGFLSQFIGRQGLWMLASHGAVKVLGFAAVVAVTRMVTEADYGLYAYAMGLVASAVPFMGFGAYQAFVRFSALAPSQLAKFSLHRHAMGWGLLGSVALSLLISLLAPWICRDLPESASVLGVLAWVIVSTFIFEHTKGLARALHLNRMSAQVDLTFAVLLVAGAYIGARTIGIQGYAFAVVLSPIVASLPFMIRLNAHRITGGRVHQGMEGFWSYGLNTAIGGMFGQALFAVDIFMLGRLWVESPDDLAIYRVAWLIPLATQVMPSAVAATDFVRNAAMADDAAGIRSYVLQYWKSFGLVSLVGLSVAAALAPWLLSIFGPGYPRGAQWMQIMLVGVLGAHLLRIPMGNLLSALGRARWNTWTSAAVLVLAGVGCAWRIPSDGLLGAAQVMAFMLWVNGLISLALVWHHMRLAQR